MFAQQFSCCNHCQPIQPSQALYVRVARLPACASVQFSDHCRQYSRDRLGRTLPCAAKSYKRDARTAERELCQVRCYNRSRDEARMVASLLSTVVDQTYVCHPALLLLSRVIFSGILPVSLLFGYGLCRRHEHDQAVFRSHEATRTSYTVFCVVIDS